MTSREVKRLQQSAIVAPKFYDCIIINADELAARHDGEACAAWLGPDGAGHFVKTMHNGIDYADMQIIAFVTDGVSVRRILEHIGEPADPPRIAPARGPPAWEEEAEPLLDPLGQPEPDFQFDQTVSW